MNFSQFLTPYLTHIVKCFGQLFVKERDEELVIYKLEQRNHHLLTYFVNVQRYSDFDRITYRGTEQPIEFDLFRCTLAQFRLKFTAGNGNPL